MEKYYNIGYYNKNGDNVFDGEIIKTWGYALKAWRGEKWWFKNRKLNYQVVKIALEKWIIKDDGNVDCKVIYEAKR